MRPGKLFRLLVVSPCLWSPPTEAQPSGVAAIGLFPNDEVLRVRVSPDGEWIVATAYSGKTIGLMAQRLGRRDVEVVFATKYGARSINWVGRDTLLAEFGSGSRRQFLRVQFRRTENGGFEFEKSTFRVLGHLVDSLPLIDGQLIWEVDHNGRNTVHRISLDELERFWRIPPSRHARVRLGELVASIEGTSRRWLVDTHGVPLVAWREDPEGNTLLYRSSADAEFEEIHSHQFDDGNLLRPQGWTRDGRIGISALPGFVWVL